MSIVINLLKIGNVWWVEDGDSRHGPFSNSVEANRKRYELEGWTYHPNRTCVLPYDMKLAEPTAEEVKEAWIKEMNNA